jgi:hypothetical protein
MFIKSFFFEDSIFMIPPPFSLFKSIDGLIIQYRGRRLIATQGEKQQDNDAIE